MMTNARRAFDALTAIVAAAAICLGTMFAANAAVESDIYRRSKVFSMLLQQETIGFSSLLEDSRNIDLAIKFAAAVTSAYINFELIPVNEGETFVALFESLPEDVIVESIAYRRKTIEVEGSAETQQAYETFLEALRTHERFSAAAGQCYESTGGGVKYEIDCEVD